jgi:hypothetical protein
MIRTFWLSLVKLSLYIIYNIFICVTCCIWLEHYRWLYLKLIYLMNICLRAWASGSDISTRRYCLPLAAATTDLSVDRHKLNVLCTRKAPITGNMSLSRVLKTKFKQFQNWQEFSRVLCLMQFCDILFLGIFYEIYIYVHFILVLFLPHSPSVSCSLQSLWLRCSFLPSAKTRKT